MRRPENLWGSAFLIALMAVTAVVLFRGQSATSLIEILSHMQMKYILLGLLLMVCFVSCEALASYSLLHRLGHNVPLKNCLGYSFVGFYFSSITPSATGGQPAQVYCMAKDGVPAAHGTLNMVVISICYQVGTLLYGLVAWFTVPALREGMNGVMGGLLIYGGGVMGVITALMIGAMVCPAPLYRAGERGLLFLARFGAIPSLDNAKAGLERQLAEYGAGAQCIRRNPDLVLRLLGLTALQLTAIYTVPYVVYVAFGLNSVGIWEILCLQALLSLAVGSLPLPGTVGAAEGVFIHAFALYFGAELVTPAMLVSRGISFYAFLLLSGLVALMVHLAIRSRDRQRTIEKLRQKSGGRVRAVEQYLIGK